LQTEINPKYILQKEGITQPLVAVRLLGQEFELFLYGGDLRMVCLDQQEEQTEKEPSALAAN
jgi:hypothetical protein